MRPCLRLRIKSSPANEARLTEVRGAAKTLCLQCPRLPSQNLGLPNLSEQAEKATLNEIQCSIAIQNALCLELTSIA
jgi:hypothetical protein